MPDKNEFIVMFKAEAEEMINKLEKKLVEFEKNPGRLELAKELNMEAHTLKGAARVFGFRQIQEITHKIEDVFDRVGKQTLGFTPPMASMIFKALDKIRALLGKTTEPDIAERDISAICHGLESCLSEDKLTKERPEELSKTAEPPVAEEPVSGPAPGSPEPAAEEYIRVPLSRVNKLLNLAGEMVIHKMKSSAKINQLRKLNVRTKEIHAEFEALDEIARAVLPDVAGPLSRKISQCRAGIEKFKEDSLRLLDGFVSETFRLDPVIDELQSQMKKIRMIPLSTICEGFPRMVRDIASAGGKEVDLIISGAETELDKKVLNGIKAPLIHILRNAVDHGIEPPSLREGLGKPRLGSIRLSAWHQAGNVVIRIEDDGRGLDTAQIRRTAVQKGFVTAKELEAMTENEIMNIVFMNGYSTSPIITDISGRGIGLDVVRRDIEYLKGQVLLESQAGKGTAFTLILPLTIAIIRVLLVKLQEKLFALPMASINEILDIHSRDVSTLDGKMAIQVRGHIIPVVRLDEVLGMEDARAKDGFRESASSQPIPVIVVSSLGKKIGLMVGEIAGEEEIFIKSLGAHLGKVKNVSGAAILGTGQVVVILDVDDLLVSSRLSHPAILERAPVSEEPRKEKKILVVDDVISTRELERSILEARGYRVETAVDGFDALEKIMKTPFDLVISDVQMPRMDGFQFCGELKKNEQCRDIPVIIVTSLDREEDKRRGIEAGASAYIVKTSFDQSNLLDAIERLIG
jgi:two-component system chemotaxis sensor kinase CheA